MQDYCRSEELWFEDGNIVLEAESVVFRIYRGNLAAHSSIFEAMFSFPQPAQHELSEMLDGCPIVHMPDSAEHLRYFLVALNDFGFAERIAKASFPEVIGVLRLAAKYDVAYLRLRAAGRLRDWFPDTLDAFCISGYKSGHIIQTHISDDVLFISLDLARVTGMHICLPVILFRICSLDLQRILAPGNLDLQTQLLVLNANATLTRLYRTEIWRWLYKLTPGCATSPDCAAFRAELSFRFEEDRAFSDVQDMFDPEPFGSPHVCATCIGDLHTTMRVRQQKVWDTLPEIFGLGTWDELRQAVAESETV